MRAAVAAPARAAAVCGVPPPGRPAPPGTGRRLARDADLLCQGGAANPLPPPAPAAGPPKRGRRQQSAVRNLLDRLFPHQEEARAFLDAFAVPCDNNRVERDLRMLQVQQKISGCFRSSAGALACCRIRGVLSTGAKHGLALLDTLQMPFAGHTLTRSVTT